jgi:hypothetical protein
MGRLIDHLKLMENHDEKFLNGMVKSINVEVMVDGDIYVYRYDYEEEQKELKRRFEEGDPGVTCQDTVKSCNNVDDSFPKNMKTATNGRCIVNN